MSSVQRNGNRKTRDQLSKRRVPELGYYFIVTDTKETEQNYMLGLRDSIPSELRGKLVIKVAKTRTQNLVTQALELHSLYPQYGEIWIVFDRDQVKDFDEIIFEAIEAGINVGWTNTCIEEWFCAYFGSMPTYENSVSCCANFGEIFYKKTGQKYVKSDPKIYEKLNGFGDENKAIALAIRKMQEHEKAGNFKPSQCNPGTTLHLLVSEIRAKIGRTSV